MDFELPFDKTGMVSEVIPGFAWRAIHVFAPALQERIANPAMKLPTAALRSAKNGFVFMRLFEHIEMLGPGRGNPPFSFGLT